MKWTTENVSRRIRQIVVPALASGLLLSACMRFEQGRDFDATATERFEIGTTTKADVLAALGPPTAKSTNSVGAETWQYAYSKMTQSLAPSPWLLLGVTETDSTRETKMVFLQFEGDILKEMSAHASGETPGGIKFGT